MSQHRFLRNFPCPCCGAPLKITSSVQQHAMFKDQYARCENAFCAASFMLRTEVLKTISPPSPVFASKNLHSKLQLSPSDLTHNAQYCLDIAREFIARPWQAKTSPHLIIERCVAYLREHLKLSHEQALSFANQAQEELGLEV